MKQRFLIFRSALSVLLALSILLSMVPLGAFAWEREGATRTSSAIDPNALITAIEGLEPVASIAQFYDHTVHGKNANMYNVKGIYFLVNVLTYKGAKYAFAMDPTSISYYGKVPAIPVTLVNTDASGLPTTGTTLLGVTADMALEFSKDTEQWHFMKLFGPYEEAEGDYYLFGHLYDDDPDTGVDSRVGLYAKKKVDNTTRAYSIALNDRHLTKFDSSHRVSLTYDGPMTVGSASKYYHYIGLNTADPTAEEIYYEIDTNLSAPHGQSSYIAFLNYYNTTQNGVATDTYEQVTSYMFSLRQDLVDTAELYESLQAVKELLSRDERYDQEAYDALVSKVQEAVALYEAYNGVSQDTATVEAAQAETEAILKDMGILSSVLEINKSTTGGSEIFCFDGDLYRWDEEEMNTLTAQKDTGTSSKGLYFADSAIPSGITQKGLPLYSTVLTQDSYKELLNLSGTKLPVSYQNYAIYSGLASESLSGSDPLRNSTAVVQGGLFDSGKLTGDSKVYENVGIPFVYDKDTGYYSLNSDTNGVYFAGEPEDGAQLQISHKPALFNIGVGGVETAENPKSFVASKYSNYGLYDAYVTGFQPFAQLSNRSWKGFPSSSSVTDPTLVDGYLLTAVPDETDIAYYGEMGKAIHGIGMSLELDFTMTEDGMAGDRPITLELTGDDDIWVYIDGKLVLDMGGIHGAVQGSIDFSTGVVSLRSEQFGKIADLAGTYGQNDELYRFTTVPESLNAVTYGTSLALGSVASMKDGSVPVRMYQENIYTSAISGEEADEDYVRLFSQQGSHTLTIFYMDRDQSRSDCGISFNLPLTDSLTVENKIAELYGGGSKAISEETMATLNTWDFGYTLLQDEISMPYESFTVYDKNGEYVRADKTDGRGRFTLKNGQRAEFLSLQFRGQSYRVVADTLSEHWAQPQWIGSAEGSALPAVTGSTSAKAVVEGTQTGREAVSFTCTHTYVYDPLLSAEALTIVMDYGKPMDIALAEDAVVNGASELLVRKGRVVSAEILGEGASCGTATIEASCKDGTDRKDIVRFTLTKFMDRAIELRCTLEFALEDGTLRTLEIPVLLLPATVMYYETDFVLGGKVFSMEVKGATEDKHQWTLSGTGDTASQDGGEVGNTVYAPEIQRESIPMNAFFVDFDGDGYENRYSIHPLYNGLDFDSETLWGHTHQNTPEIAVDQKAGTLTLTLAETSITGTANHYGYVQTKDPADSNYYSDPLNYAPGEDHYFEIRLKILGGKPITNVGASVRLYMSTRQDGKNTTIGTKEDYEAAFGPTDSEAYGEVFLPNENMINEEYVTLRVDLGNIDYFTEADVINAFRIHIQNVVARDSGVNAKAVIDYVYVGPKTSGIQGNSAMREYLFFGFENTRADRERYDKLIYGGNRNGDTGDDRNFDNGAWSYGKGWVNAVDYDNEEGTMTMTVTSNNGGDAFVDTFFNVGYTASSNRSIVQPTINYHPHKDDIAEIRLKLEGFTPSDETFVFLNYFLAEGANGFTEKSGTQGDKVYTTEYNAFESFVTIRMRVLEQFLNAEKIDGLRIFFGELQGTGTATIDYLYVGPEEGLDTIGKQDEYLYFTFNDMPADRERYDSPLYDYSQFDGTDPLYWAYESTMRSYGITKDDFSGTLISHSKGSGMDYVHTGKESGGSVVALRETPLEFDPSHAEIAQIRFRVEGMTAESDPTVTLFYCEHNNLQSYMPSAGQKTAPATAVNNGEYVTVTIELNETFRNAKRITAVRPSLGYLEGDGGKIIIDYLYIGAKAEACPAPTSLFFGFDDLEEDRHRYDSNSYSGINFDASDVENWYFFPKKTTSLEINSQEGVLVAVAQGTLPDLSNSTSASQRYPDLYIDTARAGYYQNTPLHYHPQYAEVYQVRFKMTGFTRGTYINENLTESTISPYVTLQHTDNGVGKPAGDMTGSVTESYYYDMAYVNNDTYLTLTLDIKDEFRNANCIHKLRPFFGGIESIDPDHPGQITIDYIYIGPRDQAPDVYGYDSTYTDDETLSNDSSYMVEGLGVKLNENTKAYTQVQFSFRGTGFDIISRTGKEQATIRVELSRIQKDAQGQIVYDEAGQPKVELVKTLTMNNKGELELYQIPVVSMEGLEYDEYTVKLWVNSKVESNFEILNRGGQFYFDAVRIYGPMDPNSTDYSTAGKAYQADHEAFPHFKEVRNILLTSAEFADLMDTAEGAVFVDTYEVTDVTVPEFDENGVPTGGSIVVAEPDFVVNEHYALDVNTYDKIGPKNEVYLAPGQAVAFRLQISTSYVPTSVDVAVKTIEEEQSGLFVAGVVGKDKTVEDLLAQTYHKEVTVSSATAQYYELKLNSADLFKETVGGKTYRYCYIVLYNGTTVGKNDTGYHVISVTDLKLAYKNQPEVGLPKDEKTDREIILNPEEPEQLSDYRSTEQFFTFVVDGQTVEAAALVMGGSLAETPILEEGTKVMHSLNLASDISMNYVVSKADLEGYDSFYLQCDIPQYEGSIFVGTLRKVLPAVEKGEFYYFTLEGLTAVQIPDRIEAVLYMEKDGRSYYSNTDVYSVAQYAYGQLGKSNASQELKTLCAELLRYGACAQIYKDYRTDFLADKALTQEQTALLAELDTVEFGSTNRTLSDLDSPVAQWVGKALILDSKVTLRYVVDPGTDAEDISVRVRYLDCEGAEQTVTLTEGKPYGNKAGCYSFDLDCLLAAELRTVLSAAVYAGESRISNTLEYSIDTYGKGKTGDLGTLCKALLAYSDAAKTFFAN